MKRCNRCNVEKPFSEFYRQDGSRYRSVCKPCYAAHNENQREKHHELRKAYDAARGTGWGRSGREKYEPTEAEKHDKYLERTYGITLKHYDEMLTSQGGVCAICKQACNRSDTERFCVDHDHKTGKVRGLLCFKCNTALGNANDDIGVLLRAVDYLRASRSTTLPSVFVCGPMSGLPRFNYPAFNKAARRLRALGHRVENPAENPEPIDKSWNGYMRLSIRQLVTCDAIHLLPGWEKSKGATLEAHIAERLELEVLP